MTEIFVAPDEEGWEGILDPGESILWQGRSDRRVDWSGLLGAQAASGAALAAFAVFWMIAASRIGAAGPWGDGLGGAFPLFGLVLLAGGLYQAVGRLLWDALLRARTWYTLTDRAAYIATDLLGRRLERHALGPDLRLALEEGDPGTVWFAERIVHHPGERTGSGTTARYRLPYTTRHPIGFRRIPDARTVWRLLRGAAEARIEQQLAPMR